MNISERTAKEKLLKGPVHNMIMLCVFAIEEEEGGGKSQKLCSSHRCSKMQHGKGQNKLDFIGSGILFHIFNL